MPSVMSTFERKHDIHVFDGFGSINVPHSQQSLYKRKKFQFSKLIHQEKKKNKQTYIFDGVSDCGST